VKEIRRFTIFPLTWRFKGLGMSWFMFLSLIGINQWWHDAKSFDRRRYREIIHHTS